MTGVTVREARPAGDRSRPFLLAIRIATEALHLTAPAGFLVADSTAASLRTLQTDVLLDTSESRRAVAQATLTFATSLA